MPDDENPLDIDFVTLGEARALAPLLPDPTDWQGSTSCMVKIKGRGDNPERTARFRLYHANQPDGALRRHWVIESKVLFVDESLDNVILAAFEGSAGDELMLLLHEKLALERRVDLLERELGLTGGDPDDERQRYDAALTAAEERCAALAHQLGVAEDRLTTVSRQLDYYESAP